MVKWVVQEPNGNIRIIGTSGFEPPGALGKAKPNWSADEISYDKTSGLVFLDPEKIRTKAKSLQTESRKREFKESMGKLKTILKWAAGAGAIIAVAIILRKLF